MYKAPNSKATNKMSHFKQHNITHQSSIDHHETSLRPHDVSWAVVAIGLTITFCIVLFITKFLYDTYSAGHRIGDMESSRDVPYETHREINKVPRVAMKVPPPPFGDYETSQRVAAGVLPLCTPPPRFSLLGIPYPAVIKTSIKR
jgi:hypothetical protein